MMSAYNLLRWQYHFEGREQRRRMTQMRKPTARVNKALLHSTSTVLEKRAESGILTA